MAKTTGSPVKAVKAVEVSTAIELLDSKKTRYSKVITEALTEVKATNKSNLTASVSLGKALTEVQSGYKEAKMTSEAFLTWVLETFNLHKAEVYNLITLAKPENKKVIEDTLKKGSGVGQAMKTIRDNNKAKKNDGKVPNDKVDATPTFEYVIRRTAKELKKPEEGDTGEISEHLLEAIQSVISGHEEEASIVEELLGLLETYVVAPVTETAKEKKVI